MSIEISVSILGMKSELASMLSIGFKRDTMRKLFAMIGEMVGQRECEEDRVF